MIGYLSGILLHQRENSVTVDTHGVGYIVHLSPSAGRSMDLTIGSTISLFISTYVREDQITLFGFHTFDEQYVFELLLTVSGIGPKSALAVLAAGFPEDIKTAISMANIGFFTSVSGVGKKSAQRIIVDLKGKLGNVRDIDLTDDQADGKQDVIAALRSMGFHSSEAREATKHVDTKLPLENQIRQALRVAKPVS